MYIHVYVYFLLQFLGKAEKKAFPRPESDSSCDSEINKEQARKPCDGTTPVKDLVSTVNSVFQLLDVDGINDWKVLTGKLGKLVSL